MSSKTIYTLKEDGIRGKVVLFDLDRKIINSTRSKITKFFQGIRIIWYTITRREDN